MTNLSLGKSVEQWLGFRVENGYRVISWLSIVNTREGSYRLWHHESFDDGSDDFIDVYEFERYHPDLEDRNIKTFDTYLEALEASYQVYNAQPGKFVSSGMIQAEYEKYLEFRDSKN